MLYQYGTMAGLMDRALNGTITVKEILKHGDFGIGTFDGIDGEMIAFDGKVYKVDSFGNATLQKDDALLPFANMAKFETKHSINSKLTFDSLAEVLAPYFNKNYFYAIKITGTFSKMATRVPKKHFAPYPTLAEIIKTQSVFEYENTTGTIVGFFSPEYVQGVGIGGFHLHYLNAAHTEGGHIFDFNIEDAKIEISAPLNFNLELPRSNEYEDVNVNLQTLQEEIHKVETID